MILHIGESILEFLYRDGKAYLPGLGTFRLRNSPKKFTLDNHVLTPPTQKLVLDPDKGGKGFTNYIADKYKIKSSTADFVLSKFAKKVNNCLLNFGSCGINSLGLIKKTKDGQMVIEPTVGNYHPSYLFLEPISLKPLEGGVNVANVDKDAQSDSVKLTQDTPKEPTSNITDAASAAVAGTTSAMAATTLASGQGVETSFAIKESTSQKKSLSQSLNEAYKNQVGKSQSSTTTDSAQMPYTPAYEEEKSLFSKLLWPLLLLAIILLSVFGCMRYCGDGLSLGTKGTSDKMGVGMDESTDSDNSNLTDSSNAGSIIDSALLSQPNYIKYKDVLTPQNLSTGCIIIVGSFTKSTNVTKMKDQIIRAGLEPYTEAYGEFTRVGTLFECLDHDLEGYIDTLRTSFEPRSWYLEPDLEVPYK